jgi:drug/metabolite transporter (DMT)-like permease
VKQRLLLTVHLPLLLTTIFWGTNFVALRRLLHTLTVPDTIVVRGIVASLCYGLSLLALGRSNVRVARGDLPRILIIAVCGGLVTPITTVLAQRYISASVSSLLSTTNPLWTAFFAWLILGTMLSRRRVLGIGVAFLGFVVILLFGGPSVSFSASNMLGVFIFTLSPLTWGLYSVLAKPLLTRYPSVQLVSVTTIIGSTLLLPLLFTGTPGRVAQLSRGDWFALFWVAVIALWLSYIFWFRGLNALQPAQVAVYIYLVPCFGVIAARIFLQEPITPFVLLGGATILAGVVITNSPSRADRTRPAIVPATAQGETV